MLKSTCQQLDFNCKKEKVGSMLNQPFPEKYYKEALMISLR